MANYFDKYIQVNATPEPVSDVENYFSKYLVSTTAEPEATEAPTKKTDHVTGLPETMATLGSSMIAEPIAGLAGIAGSILPGKTGQGSEWIEKVRDKLTVKPWTEAGKKTVEALGSALEPVGKAVQAAETYLGDKTFEMTGSPTLAAAAATGPTAVLEALGFVGAKVPNAIANRMKVSKQAKRFMSLDADIVKAAPSTSDLFDASRSIFKELDDSGIRVSAEAYKSLASEIRASFNAAANSEAAPRAFRSLVQKIDEAAETGSGIKLVDLDGQRSLANKMARVSDNIEAAAGRAVVNTIDDFLDRAGLQALENVPEGTLASKVGASYKAGRELWKRARKSEMMDNIFETVQGEQDVAKGLQREFGKIARSKKKRKLFTDEELNVIQKVSRGDTTGLTKKISVLQDWGLKPGRTLTAIPVIGTAGAAGYAVGGPAGSAIALSFVPIIGSVTKKLGDRLVANNAKLADAIIKSGKDARKIVRAYKDVLPANLRSVEELSELLAKSGMDNMYVDLMTPDMFERQAVRMANARLKMLSGAAVTGSIANQGDR